jgi:hypothetical protein
MRNNWPVRLNPEGWTTKQLEAALKSMKARDAERKKAVEQEKLEEKGEKLKP